MRYLKIFNNKAERDAAVEAQEVNVNSVTIWNISDDDPSNGKIEFGVGNIEHTINLGQNSEEDILDSSDND
ncbi:MAG: hypothetical protein IJH39_11020 [Clostridia bacterium]|nr:hypothetical protein [Clostridia bacterium]